MTSLEDLVGRADDATAVASLLVDHPLVTLHGPGGVGKTTLATTLAHALESEFPGGVHVVELSSAGRGNVTRCCEAQDRRNDTRSSDPPTNPPAICCHVVPHR